MQTQELTLKRRVQIFWGWFMLHQPEIEQQVQEGHWDYAAALIGSNLDKLGLPALCEVRSENSVYTLSFSPCGDKTRQFICRFMVQMAPELKKWQFYAFRRPSAMASEELMHITGNDWSPHLFRVFCTIDDHDQKYHLFVTSPVFQGRPEGECVALCRMIFYLFLGEAYTEVYIGDVRCGEQPPEEEDLGFEMSLPDFCDLVRRTPAERPWSCVNDPTSLCFGYQAHESDSDAMREDIIGGFSRHMHLLASPYAESAALAQMGGAFCYFYYVPGPLSARDRTEERADLVAHLEQLLGTYSLGYVLGSAQGTDFCYIDLIIFDEPEFRAVFEDSELLLGIQMNIDYFGRNMTGEPIQ